ncbi:MAG: hypothetical protein M1824_003535 [Vezdaea acicularis]|nr:MAG: hypothetical protein M1824_003535 [Vezdaea acicularis]
MPSSTPRLPLTDFPHTPTPHPFIPRQHHVPALSSLYNTSSTVQPEPTPHFFKPAYQLDELEVMVEVQQRLREFMEAARDEEVERVSMRDVKDFIALATHPKVWGLAQYVVRELRFPRDYPTTLPVHLPTITFILEQTLSFRPAAGESATYTDSKGKVGVYWTDDPPADLPSPHTQPASTTSPAASTESAACAHIDFGPLFNALRQWEEGEVVDFAPRMRG